MAAKLLPLLIRYRSFSALQQVLLREERLDIFLAGI
jgi:hypothetical protein